MAPGAYLEPEIQSPALMQLDSALDDQVIDVQFAALPNFLLCHVHRWSKNKLQVIVGTVRIHSIISWYSDVH